MPGKNYTIGSGVSQKVSITKRVVIFRLLSMGQIAQEGLSVEARLQIVPPMLRDDQASAEYRVGSRAFRGNITVSRQEDGWLIEYEGSTPSSEFGQLVFTLSSKGEINLVKESTSEIFHENERLPEELLSRMRRAVPGHLEIAAPLEPMTDDKIISFVNRLKTGGLKDLFGEIDSSPEMSAEHHVEIQDTLGKLSLQITAGKAEIILDSSTHKIDPAENQIDGATVGMTIRDGLESGKTSLMISMCCLDVPGEYPHFDISPLKKLCVVAEDGAKYSASVTQNFLSFTLPADGLFRFSAE